MHQVGIERPALGDAVSTLTSTVQFDESDRAERICANKQTLNASSTNGNYRNGYLTE